MPMRMMCAILVLAVISIVASVEIMTAANAAYNPFDCSKRWGSNSSACNTGGGGDGGRRGGGGGGGGGHR
jgi:uncharacterized membrane protein